MNRKDQWDEVFIQQSAIGLNSRSEANPFYGSNSLTPNTFPIFVAPMDTVVSHENLDEFTSRGLNVCIPRMPDTNFNSIEKINNVQTFYSVSLTLFEKIIQKDDSPNYRILIDVANGNMPQLHDLIRQAKAKFGEKIIIMAGNVGSVDAFVTLDQTGVDFIRVGIGGGSACNTAIHTGIYQHTPQLLKELSLRINNAKIVADGGFKSYSQIIKALALGADYVMCGGIFNKALESSSEKVLFWENMDDKPKKLNAKTPLKDLITYMQRDELFTLYRGMSTQEVQRKWGKDKIRHSEGKSFYNKVEYTLDEWINGSEWNPDDIAGFINVLKSTMSYTGCRTILELIKGDLIINL